MPWIVFDCELVTYVLLEEENSIQGLVWRYVIGFRLSFVISGEESHLA